MFSAILISIIIAQSPFKTQIEFSGRKWGVFTNYDKLSESQFTKDSIFVDSLGYLHLKAWRVKTDSGYKYFASGIVSTDKHLFGIYKFETYGRLDRFFNTCFAPFLFDWDRGVYELDIEYSRWSREKNNPGNYNLHYMPKGKHYKKHFDFKLPKKPVDAFHYIYVYPDSLVFKTTVLKHGKEKTYGYWVVKDKKFIPRRPVYMEIYLWWPHRKKGGEDWQEMIVKKVEYIPLKQNVNNKKSKVATPEKPERVLNRDLENSK